MNNLNKLSKEIYEENKLRGFDVAKENVGQTLMLIVSELAEALESDRENRYADIDLFERELSVGSDIIPFNERFKNSFNSHIKDTFEDELIDAMIRLLDLCGAKNIDIDQHMKLKREYNKTREHKHGKKY